MENHSHQCVLNDSLMLFLDFLYLFAFAAVV